MSALDEAPYKRLKKTPAYEKFTANQKEQIEPRDALKTWEFPVPNDEITYFEPDAAAPNTAEPAVV